MWSNLLMVLLGNLLAPVFNGSSNSSDDRIPAQDRRFVSLVPVWTLPIVNLRRDPCNALFQDRIGNCESKFECHKHQGKKDGLCALGFGVCCTYQRTCGATIYRNNTYFVSPNYPSGYVPSKYEICTVAIRKTSRICQMRLDFLETDLEQGDTNGVCRTDNLWFSNAVGPLGRIPPNLCGSLAVNSMYVHFESNDHILMNILTDGERSSRERKWNIRISFIPCRTEYTAPPDCTQYFTGIAGEVKILGYPQFPHLGDLSYTVCVRNEENARAIGWNRCTGEPTDQSFWMTGPPLSMQVNAQTACSGGDFVVIMRTHETTRTDDRHCGNSLNADPTLAVRTIDRPFILKVKTDAIESTDEARNTGFCLQWTQEF